MDTFLKALLYIGTVVAIGAGVFRWFVAPESLRPEVSGRLRTGLVVGCALVLVASPLQIVVTISNLLGRFDPSLGTEYLVATRHGVATLARFVAIALLIAATLLPFGRTAGRSFFTVSALLLLATFSWTSHAVAVAGTLPLVADLLHFAAAAGWAGAVLYAAWMPFWERPGTPQVVALNRVSSIGATAVMVLFATGLYTALLHVSSPQILASSPYGRVLSVKNLLVLLIVAVAAVNRWWFLPRIRRGQAGPSFRRLFRAEAMLLLAVLAVTGLLTTSALPHEPGVPPDPLESLRNFLPDRGTN
ncbi:MAG TPA: CopD family protein [Trueperaceae bacterium]